MPYFRRRPMRRRLPVVVQGFKQVVNQAPVSIAAATQNTVDIVKGVDNYTGPDALDRNVPTGAVVKFFEIQISLQNLVNVAAFVWITVQRLEQGQAYIDGQTVGGANQRNQVYHQVQRAVGQNQNVNITIRFRVPKGFQRVRANQFWGVTIKSDQITTQATQVIYKFYR